VTIDGGQDDRSLLAAHVHGDPDAFASLVRRHRDRMWAVAIRTLGDREEAADALQEAFISALRGADRFRGDSEVSTWLHRIVVNACLDRLRRRKARPTVPLDGHELRSRRDDHAATLTRLDLRAALDRLPDAQRVALVLVDIEDVPVAEAAALLGVAEGTVKSRCARGRMALASAMRPGYDAAYDDKRYDAARGNPDAGPGVTGTEGVTDTAAGTDPADSAGQGR
jgi:RNA polymerase sigma-70 factor (ECF subfamily)